ncbi:MAG: FkbM family methyltransferase [Rhodospirillaceae bacterium]
MTEDAIREFLKFFGGNRYPRGPVAPDWNIDQLRYGDIHFGLAGEDVVLRNVLKRRIWSGKPGRYVDIGCHRPAFISNTYFFYLIGWRGLCVDANPAFAADWATIRPQDAYVHAAIGGGASRFFLENKLNLGASIVSDSPNPPTPDFAPGIQVPVKRLDTLLHRTIGNKPIELMSIDIEGGEMAALQTNDWDRWRPSVIMLECSNFSFDEPYLEPTVAYLHRMGYSLEARVSANVVLTAGELV